MQSNTACKEEEATVNPLVGAEAIARATSSTVPTVHSWVKRGVIPVAVREGRVVRFVLGDVMEALQERAEKRSGKGGANA